MTGATPARDCEEIAEPAITDVWSRTSSKYRVRSAVLLAVNLLLFAGVGCFTYWLRTGIALALAKEDYWAEFLQTLRPKGEATLANFVLFPISVDVIPVHGLVVGLLLAALVSIPILISILYRFPACIPFILVIAFLAVMPWLAINLTGACILASVKPFRFRFRYASALLGLLLVLFYFYGASRQTAPLVEAYRPEDRIKFVAPFVLATIASCVIMGGVLFLARMVNYRPGVVAPLLLIAFAVPVAVFERHVGRAELHYRLLEHRFRGAYVDHDARDWFDGETYKEWVQMPESDRPPLETFRELAALRISLHLDGSVGGTTAFAELQGELMDKCDRFIRHFPDSRYAPNVLYMRGEILDMRVDVAAFRNEKLIRYYSDFPSDASRTEWRRVVANAGDSSIAAVARYKLAILAARWGRLDEAAHELDEILARFDRAATEDEPAEVKGVVETVLERAPADAGLKVPVDQTVFDARRLRALILHNGQDPRYGVRPFSGSLPNDDNRHPGLFTLDPGDPRYAANLESIVTAFPGCDLSDNLLLMAANLENDLNVKLIRLESIINQYPNGDARPETLFRLGTAYLEAEDIAQGIAQLETIVRDHPTSIWKTPARKRLQAMLAVPSEPTL